MQYTNEELAILAKHGDNQAIEDLFKQVQNFIYSRAIQLSMSSNIYDTDDVFGIGCEAFMKAVKFYNPNRGTKFITVLGTYMFNLYGSRYYEKEARSRKYTMSINLEDVIAHTGRDGSIPVTLGDTLESTPYDESPLYMGAYEEAINKVMMEIPEHHREVVKLHVLEGKLQREVKAITGVGTSTVSYMGRAFKAKLKAEFIERGLL